jgi:putative heme-binding domain-containing protein
MILEGLQAGLRGRRQVEMPASWAKASPRLLKSPDRGVRTLAMSVAVTFGDPAAFAELRRVAASDAAPLPERQAALTTLVEAHDKGLAPLLHQLAGHKALGGVAIRGLAGYDDPATPALLLKLYGSLDSSARRDVLNTLASRPAYGKALLDAVAAKKLPASEVPAEVVRQLRNLNDKALDQQIAEVWGVVRTSPADRLKMIAQYRQMLTRPYQAPADLALGRAVFAKTCQQCHTLFGVGAKVGPDITGSNRADLNYLLENILDPSAVIPNEYKATQIELKSGRVVVGIVREQTPAALTVLTANETLTIPRNEIDSLRPSDTSMMPDDLLKPLSEMEVRSLIAYLRSPSQTPILATAENVKDFLNGKDLTGWDGDPKLWSVENGEIVGRSPGLKKNEFLRSQMLAGDFRLTLKVKLTPNKENSGIQFRSEALPGGEVRGYQADIGAGWWGKLYEEHGRELLWKKSGEEHVKPDDWNDYEIVCVGSKVKTMINGKPCVDLDDPSGARRGIFAFQLHAGGPLEVRFKDLKLELK